MPPLTTSVPLEVPGFDAGDVVHDIKLERRF
jgi:hypothetical protein